MHPYDLFTNVYNRTIFDYEDLPSSIRMLRDVSTISEPCYKCGNPAKPAPTANGKAVCRRCVMGGNRKRGRHGR